MFYYIDNAFVSPFKLETRIYWLFYLRRNTNYGHHLEKSNPLCTFMVGPISPPGIEKSAGSIIHFWIRCAFEVALLLYLEIKPIKKELDNNNNENNNNNNELTQLRKRPLHHGRSLAMFVYFFLNSIYDHYSLAGHQLCLPVLFLSEFHLWPLYLGWSLTMLIAYLCYPFWISSMTAISGPVIDHVYLSIPFWIASMTATSGPVRTSSTVSALLPEVNTISIFRGSWTIKRGSWTIKRIRNSTHSFWSLINIHLIFKILNEIPDF